MSVNRSVHLSVLVVVSAVVSVNRSVHLSVVVSVNRSVHLSVVVVVSVNLSVQLSTQRAKVDRPQGPGAHSMRLGNSLPVQLQMGVQSKDPCCLLATFRLHMLVIRMYCPLG